MSSEKNFYLTDWDENSPKGGAVWLVLVGITITILTLSFLLL